MPTTRKWIWGCEHGNCWREGPFGTLHEWSVLLAWTNGFFFFFISAFWPFPIYCGQEEKG